MSKKIITIGEAMGLFVADEVGRLEDVQKFTRSIAGAELNVSVGLARLDHEVYYATKIGSDPLGESIIKFIEKERIHNDFVYRSKKRLTGLQLKEKSIEGDPSVSSFRKNSAASKFSLATIQEVDFSIFDFVHLSGIFLALSPETKAVSHYFAEEGRRNGACITFDPNLRPNLWGSKEEMIKNINELATKCDIVLPGISEGKILTGYNEPEDIANFYLEGNAKYVVIKLGEEGAYVKGNDKEGKYINGFKVAEIVDTVGAGDGFAVGVVSGLAEGLSIEESVTRGNAIGAIQLLSTSDNEGLPNRGMLDNFLNTSKHQKI
ncbi:sugar kinase [Paraliobacillus sediminis]|uniref:sugar kinase n=1 Tax=Paraliobacillus sediminis TaxID=1885916 RepID=UPI000E3E6DDE|nr:sugar kinase [Paraliobacillus sediminis]